MPDMRDAAISFPVLGEGFILNFKAYITVFGWKFYWYGIIIAFGFLLAVIYTFKRTKQFGLTDDNFMDMLIWAVPLAIVSARVYYVIFSGWKYTGVFWEDALRIISLWNGGLAIYGAVIGGLLGCFIYTKRKRICFGAMADLSSLGLLIGQAVGRWGNFTNREAFGGKTSMPWKMGLTNQYGTFYYHPCFLYESLWNLLGFLLLHFYSKKRRYDGEIFVMYICWYGIGRLIIEGFRQDSLYLGNTNLRVSQLVAIACAMAGLGVFIYNRVVRIHEPEDLWVNRTLAEPVIPNEISGEIETEPDDELSDALRILNNSRRPDGADAETAYKEPSLEPANHEAAENEQD